MSSSSMTNLSAVYSHLASSYTTLRGGRGGGGGGRGGGRGKGERGGEEGGGGWRGGRREGIHAALR